MQVTVVYISSLEHNHVSTLTLQVVLYRISYLNNKNVYAFAMHLFVLMPETQKSKSGQRRRLQCCGEIQLYLMGLMQTDFVE